MAELRDILKSLTSKLIVGGSESNATETETDGTSVAIGDATCWEDANIDAKTVFGFGSAPDIVNLASTNIEVSAFSATTEEEIDSVIELPHARVSGSDISFHVHWYPTNTNTGTVRWGLEYVAVGEGETVTTGTTITVDDVASGTAWTRQSVSFANIAVSGDFKQFHFRF